MTENRTQLEHLLVGVFGVLMAISFAEGFDAIRSLLRSRPWTVTSGAITGAVLIGGLELTAVGRALESRLRRTDLGLWLLLALPLCAVGIAVVVTVVGDFVPFEAALAWALGYFSASVALPAAILLVRRGDRSSDPDALE